MTKMKVIVSYGFRFRSGMIMIKRGVLNVETGELEEWDNIPIHAVRGDTPVQEVIYLATSNPYFSIEKEIVNIGKKKFLAKMLTEEEKKEIKSL